MVSPLLDATLEGLDAKMAEHNPGHVVGAFRFGDRVEDTRALSLALDQGRFDLFKLTVDIAEGARSGVFILGLPHVPLAQKTPTSDASQSDYRGSGIKSVALDASIPLTAVIARLNEPLNLICAFQPGMVLPLPADCLSQAELSARPRHLVAEVQLGQVNGMRAVRLRLPSDEDAPTVVLPDSVTHPEKPAQEAQDEPSAMPAIPQDEPKPLADLPDDWSPEDDLPEFALNDPLPLASMSRT
jgi:flagellar motor switch protein FliM